MMPKSRVIVAFAVALIPRFSSTFRKRPGRPLDCSCSSSTYREFFWRSHMSRRRDIRARARFMPACCSGLRLSSGLCCSVSSHSFADAQETMELQRPNHGPSADNPPTPRLRRGKRDDRTTDLRKRPTLKAQRPTLNRVKATFAHAVKRLLRGSLAPLRSSTLNGRDDLGPWHYLQP